MRDRWRSKGEYVFPGRLMRHDKIDLLDRDCVSNWREVPRSRRSITRATAIGQADEENFSRALPASACCSLSRGEKSNDQRKLFDPA